MVRSVMTTPINGLPPPATAAQTLSPGQAMLRRMSEAARAAAVTQPEAQAQPAPLPAREAPFGVDRPRYQRPGSLLDIRV